MTDITQADIAKLKEAAEKAFEIAPEKWEVWDSCSWRRIGVGGRNSRTIIQPYLQRSDNHPDLLADREILDHVAAANPSTILAILSENERLRETMRQMANGWNNAVELNLIASQHRATAIILRDNARAALGDKP